MRSGRPLLWTTGLLTALVLAWAGGLVAAVWSQADASLREALAAWMSQRGAIPLLFVLLLPALLAALAWPWVRRWPREADRLREQVDIVAESHAALALQPGGAAPMRALGAAIARLAARHAALQRDVDARVAQAQARLGDETRRLAALMSELPQGVLVCTHDGRILLYNPRAAELFGSEGGAVGLGRSVFGLIDRAAIVHALEQAHHRAAGRDARAAAQLITTRRHAGTERLLRVQMVLVRDAAGDEAGYVLIVEDLTSAVDSDSRRDALLHQLTEGQRAALGSLQAAAETLQQFPALDAAQRSRFVRVIHDEAARLAHQLDAAVSQGADPLRSAWPREDMLAGDLLRALQRGLAAGSGLEVSLHDDQAPVWLQLDSHGLVQAVAHLAGRLREELAVSALRLALQAHGRFARLALRWDGAALDPARLQHWESQPLLPGQGTTVQAVLARHGAESWSLTDLPAGQGGLCLQLPVLQPGQQPALAASSSRPVYYDFDLFHQPGQSAALDETPLAVLTFTVFDTETTGLSPSGGDEIISIGAVRIVNGRLLEHECFDRLVRPRRAVGEAALAVHGIGDDMLAGQPPLEQVLPAFAHFAADTVLVAHNAAFDMRFLELARERTGVSFSQPVLDTLLLSEAVHPAHGEHEHHLEQIATRLGVPVLGRHTALGDAIVTGEVLLKLLPLLAARGVHTLGQARDASARTSHARLRY